MPQQAKNYVSLALQQLCMLTTFLNISKRVIEITTSLSELNKNRIRTGNSGFSQMAPQMGILCDSFKNREFTDISEGNITWVPCADVIDDVNAGIQTVECGYCEAVVDELAATCWETPRDIEQAVVLDSGLQHAPSGLSGLLGQQCRVRSCNNTFSVCRRGCCRLD